MLAWLSILFILSEWFKWCGCWGFSYWNELYCHILVILCLLASNETRWTLPNYLLKGALHFYDISWPCTNLGGVLTLSIKSLSLLVLSSITKKGEIEESRLLFGVLVINDKPLLWLTKLLEMVLSFSHDKGWCGVAWSENDGWLKAKVFLIGFSFYRSWGD